MWIDDSSDCRPVVRKLLAMQTRGCRYSCQSAAMVCRVNSLQRQQLRRDAVRSITRRPCRAMGSGLPERLEGTKQAQAAQSRPGAACVKFIPDVSGAETPTPCLPKHTLGTLELSPGPSAKLDFIRAPDARRLGAMRPPARAPSFGRLQALVGLATERTRSPHCLQARGLRVHIALKCRHHASSVGASLLTP